MAEIFKCYKLTRKEWLMCLEVKMQKEGTIDVFRSENATTKVQLKVLWVTL